VGENVVMRLYILLKIPELIYYDSFVVVLLHMTFDHNCPFICKSLSFDVYAYVLFLL